MIGIEAVDMHSIAVVVQFNQQGADAQTEIIGVNALTENHHIVETDAAVALLEKVVDPVYAAAVRPVE